MMIQYQEYEKYFEEKYSKKIKFYRKSNGEEENTPPQGSSNAPPATTSRGSKKESAAGKSTKNKTELDRGGNGNMGLGMLIVISFLTNLFDLTP